MGMETFNVQEKRKTYSEHIQIYFRDVLQSFNVIPTVAFCIGCMYVCVCVCTVCACMGHCVGTLHCDDIKPKLDCILYGNGNV